MTLFPRQAAGALAALLIAVAALLPAGAAGPHAATVTAALA